MTEISITNPAEALEALRYALELGGVKHSAHATSLRELADVIEQQLPVIEEPTGEVIVFVGGEYWQRDPDTENSWIGSYDRGHATWKELTATRHEVEVYRKEHMPLTAAALGALSVRAHQEKQGARFCTLTPNCRLADGHTDGCRP